MRKLKLKQKYIHFIGMFLSKNEKIGVEGYRNQIYRFEEVDE